MMESWEQIENLVDHFLGSSDQNTTIQIPCNLRRDVRKLLEYRPKLFHMLFGTVDEDGYQLLLSKIPISLNWQVLSKETKQVFQKHQEKDENVAFRSIFSMGSERDWINRHFDLHRKILQDLTSKQCFENWKNLTVLPKQLSVGNTSLPGTFKDPLNQPIYKPPNHNQKFISIDLKSASFQVLRLHGFFVENSWAEYIEKFTSDPYFINNRKLRLSIIGNKALQPQKQQVFWQNITLSILQGLLEKQIVKEENLVAFNSDELVFQYKNGTDKQILQLAAQQFPDWSHFINVTTFALYRVDPKRKWYGKVPLDSAGKPDVLANYILKCVNPWDRKEAERTWETTKECLITKSQ